jgi:hypothetical protein
MDGWMAGWMPQNINQFGNTWMIRKIKSGHVREMIYNKLSTWSLLLKDECQNIQSVHTWMIIQLGGVHIFGTHG